MLCNIQKDFINSIFCNEDISSLFSSTEKEERFEIYKSTVFGHLAQALQLTFPDTWKLLGDRYAKKIAQSYITHHPPNSPCLLDWGVTFPDFLSTTKELNLFPYLKDYATYEWLKHQSYGASNSPDLSRDLQNQMNEENTKNIQFIFKSSVFFFHSSYPIQEIQSFTKGNEHNLPSSKETYAIIARPQHEVLTFWISKPYWLFFNTLFKNQYLQHALNNSQIISYIEADQLKIADAFGFLFKQNLLTKMYF